VLKDISIPGKVVETKDGKLVVEIRYEDDSLVFKKSLGLIAIPKHHIPEFQTAVTEVLMKSHIGAESKVAIPPPEPEPVSLPSTSPCRSNVSQADKRYDLERLAELKSTRFKYNKANTRNISANIIRLVKRHPGTTNKALGDMVGLSENGICLHTNDLVKIGFLKLGKNKHQNRKYFTTEQGKAFLVHFFGDTTSHAKIESLSKSENVVYKLVKQYPYSSAGELHKGFNGKRNTLYTIISRLIEKGLITWERDVNEKGKPKRYYIEPDEVS
jgi:predicted HTH transcriptional regulator